MRMVTRTPRSATCAARVCRSRAAAAPEPALTPPGAVPTLPIDRSVGRSGGSRMERIENPRYEQASPEAMEALQLRRLQEMLRFAAATNVFYRERWDAAGRRPPRGDPLDPRRRPANRGKREFTGAPRPHPPSGHPR